MDRDRPPLLRLLPLALLPVLLFPLGLFLLSSTSPAAGLSRYGPPIEEAAALVQSVDGLILMTRSSDRCGGIRTAGFRTGGEGWSSVTVAAGPGETGGTTCNDREVVSVDAFLAQTGMPADAFDRLTTLLDSSGLWDVQVDAHQVSGYVQTPPGTFSSGLAGTYVRVEAGERPRSFPWKHRHLDGPWYWEPAD